MKTTTERSLSEKEFRSFFEWSLGLMCVVDFETAMFTKVNPSFTRILGYSEEELLERTFLDFLHPDDIQPTLDVIEHRLKKGEAVPHFENRYRTQGGDYRWLNWTGHPNLDTSFFYALARDVTESKQAESLLAGEKQILEIIATSNSQDGGLTELIEFIESQSGGMICSILLLDDDGIHLRCGASSSLPEEYCQGIDGVEIGPTVGSCGTAAFFNKTVIVSDIATDPLWDNYRDLALKHNLRACWSNPIHASSGRVLGTFAMYYDQPRSPDAFHENLIERAIHLASIAISKKKAEEELRQSELRSRTLLEGSPVCNKIIDLDSKLQYMSAAGVTQLKIPNIEDFYGCTFPPVLYPESWRRLAAEHLERAKKGETSRMECPVHDTEGQEIWFDTTFVPARDDQGDVEYVIVSSVNITERKKAEEEIRRHQDRLAHIGRLSTMGEMATGLAHEVNQPLAAIANYCYAGLHLLDRLPGADVEPLRSLFEKLSEQSLRAGEIIRRLRGLVGQRTFDRSQADIAEPIREVLRLLESNLRQSQVRWEQKTNGNISTVTIDAVQIQQVLVNLIRNAIDAMSETACDQRALTITTSQNQDDFIEVAVRDTGKGLPAEQADQVFDAFFSSKSEGMGMGLAISRSIIESHGGRMWIMPNSEQGVTFYFSLPTEKEARLDNGA